MLLFLRAIPEAIGIIGTGTVLAGKKFPMRDIVFVGMLGGITTWIFRQLPLKFGIHSILAIMVFIVVQRLFFKLDLKAAIMGTLLGFSLLGMLEYISLLIITAICDTTYNKLLGGGELLNFLSGLPSLFGILFFWLYRWHLLKDRVTED